MVVLSGIDPGKGGTGRLLQYLRKWAREQSLDVQFVFRPPPDQLTSQDLEVLVAAERLVLFHPQTIGLSATLDLIAARSRLGRQTHYYVLDCSFFCIRSYNHLDGSNAPCMECHGVAPTAAERRTCVPFPVRDSSAVSFVRGLRSHGAGGKLTFLVQNDTQGRLVREHFGGACRVEKTGLWCADWDECCDVAAREVGEAGVGYDVVFHGHGVQAKGLGWLQSVALDCPRLRFLFPLDANKFLPGAPDHVHGVPMEWSTGLRDEVVQASLTLTPSLWSAPLEGALIKSLLVARAVAVVDLPTTFARELPEGLVLRLDRRPERAARQLRDAVEAGWAPDSGLRDRWRRDFMAENRECAARILAK